MLVRLDKLLADNGMGTRSEVKKIIKNGQVTVDGKVVKGSDLKVDAAASKVAVSGKEISAKLESWYMLNKPAGYVCANEDGRNKTVFDLLDVPEKKRLFCVGRLDIDTEGLLLITDNGEVSHSLLSPKKHVSKKYYTEYSGELCRGAEKMVAEGLQVDEELKCLPAKLEITEDGKAYLTIAEGKFHQVKRMMERLGGKVTYLKRLEFGPIVLDENLKPGEYRELSEKEIEALKGR